MTPEGSVFTGRAEFATTVTISSNSSPTRAADRFGEVRGLPVVGRGGEIRPGFSRDRY
jgi:hypothetical protein